MKRGQVLFEAPLIYLLIMIILILTGLLGYSIIKDTSNKFESVKMDSLVSSLQNSINQQSKVSFGSIKDVSYVVPSNIEGFCFVDMDKKIDNLVNGRLVSEIGVFSDKNLFSLPFDAKLYFRLENFKLEDIHNPLCIMASNGKLNLRLQNNGAKTLVSPIELNDINIQCTTILFNDVNTKTLDLVFIPYGYVDKGKFRDDVFEYANEVISKTEPFKSKKGILNVFLVDIGNELKCQISSYISCDNHQTELIASRCPHDYTFILVDRNVIMDFIDPVRSSAVSNIIRVNTADNKRVIVHEFGHAFGGLADEYIDEGSYTVYNFEVDDYPNCDLSGCNKWSDINNTGCIKGCSLNSAFRSIDNSIMRSLNVDYFGELNEIIIDKKIDNYENEQ